MIIHNGAFRRRVMGNGAGDANCRPCHSCPHFACQLGYFITGIPLRNLLLIINSFNFHLHGDIWAANRVLDRDVAAQIILHTISRMKTIFQVSLAVVFHHPFPMWLQPFLPLRTFLASGSQFWWIVAKNCGALFCFCNRF